jgi:hypothetical protein
VIIDRADLSQTTSALFAPQPCAAMDDWHPSELAWNSITPPGYDTPAKPARRQNRKKKIE